MQEQEFSERNRRTTQADWVIMESDGFDPLQRRQVCGLHDGPRACHVHGFYADVEVIVDLRPDGKLSLANRTDAIRPSNGSKSDVRYVLTTAARHFDELVFLREKQHG
jgi:hypothetical protein